MATIQGITVQIKVKNQIGTDDFKRPIYEYSTINVDNVLVGEPSTDDITNTLTLTGKKVAYVLAIPKGDKNNWQNTEVSFWGETFRTIGAPIQGIESNIPLSWNKKVKVERYE